MTAAQTNLQIAERHVISGRQIVARQEALIAKTQAQGGDVAGMQELLTLFKGAQKIFEDDLRRLQAIEKS
jgi:hypothetical protein